MRRPKLRSGTAAAWASLALLACSSGTQCACSPAETAAEEAPARIAPQSDTRLIVMVVVDQLMPGQLTRLEPWLDGGLGRFLADGERWTNATHGHGITETAPGHASLATGVHPSRHGIVANQWWLDGGKAMRSVGDSTVEFIGGPVNLRTDPSSPANLITPGISDYLQQLDPASQCIAIGGKDRSAILGMGWVGEAYWWFSDGRGFVSSSWYVPELPPWVLEWNTDWLQRAIDEGMAWESLLPEGIEEAGTGADDRPGENRLFTDTTFPHEGPEFTAELDVRQIIRAAQFVYETPLVDRYTMDLAKRAVEANNLGGDEHLDYLLLGLSATDTVGHRFGPLSYEATDTILRVDHELGEFFAMLDERLGADKWTAVLSADHGVLELPESLQEKGVDARRVQGRQLLDANMATVERILAEKLGDDYVDFARFDGVSFANDAMAAAGVDLKAARIEAAKVLMQETGMFFDYALTAEALQAELREQEASGDKRSDTIEALMARSYYPDRSPDVSLVIKENYIIWRAGTTHGSPWEYDREVPLIFLGPDFEASVRDEPCYTVDVLPTLFDRLGLPVPENLDGQPLR